MQNTYVAAVGHQFEQAKEMKELGMEGFSDVIDFLRSSLSSQGTSGIQAKTLLNQSTNDSTIDRKLKNKLHATNNNALSKINIYVPQGFTGEVTPYLGFLFPTLLILLDIEKRLYTPLINHLSNNMSDPSGVDKPWINHDLSFINAKASTEEFATFFNSPYTATSVAVTIPFGQTFVSANDYILAGEKLKTLSNTIKTVNLDSLKESEDKLYDLIKLFIKTSKDNPEIISNNRQNIRKMADAVIAVSAETKLLASIMYSCMTLISTMKDSNEKLTDNLK